MKTPLKLLVALLLLFYPLAAEGKTYLVNFSSIGGVNVTPDCPLAKAWYRDTRNLPSDPYYSSDRTPFTLDDIKRIAKADDVGFSSSGQDTHHFMFSVASSAALTVKWRGHAEGLNDRVTLYVWDGSGWQRIGQISGTGWQWISGSGFVSNCQINILAIGHNGFIEYTHPTTDYIEVEATVSQTTAARVEKTGGNPRNYDAFFSTDTIKLYAKVVSNGNPVANYPVKFYAEFEDKKIFLGGSWTDSSGVAYISITPKNFALKEKWRVRFVAEIEDVMTNCNAYHAEVSRVVLAENIAIISGSYNITLVGRIYYAGGADWIRVNWYIDENSVTKPFPIPMVQKFLGKRASVTIWKYGIDDYCTDPDCHKEGIYENNGYSKDTDWDGACIAVGSKTPMCERSPGYDHDVFFGLIRGHIYNCYGDPTGPHPGMHDCTYFSGYRIGPFIQMNVPDHALGTLAAIVIKALSEGDLAKFMRNTRYSQHEGPEGVLLGINTEHAITNGLLGILADPKGGLGVVGFIGLIADEDHAIGFMMGHRYGIHPFTAIVTTVPSYPTTEAGWKSYFDVWIYHLLDNFIYILKNTGEELLVWNLRYPSNEDVLNLNRAFNNFLTDFLPYMREVLWLVVNCGKSVNHALIVSTFVQLKDSSVMINKILTNQTLNDKFKDAISEILNQTPNILGPPDASYGLNYMLSQRIKMHASERQEFNYRMLQLIDQLVEVLITVMKELPAMEKEEPSWGHNWIAGYGRG